MIILTNTFFINCLNLEQVLLECSGGPNTKLSSLLGINFVTYWNHHIQVIEFDVSSDGFSPFFLNLFQNGTSSIFFQFTITINVFYMFGYSLRIDIKNLSNLFLSTPNRITPQVSSELNGSVFCLINDQLIKFLVSHNQIVESHSGFPFRDQLTTLISLRFLPAVEMTSCLFMKRQWTSPSFYSTAVP